MSAAQLELTSLVSPCRLQIDAVAKPVFVGRMPRGGLASEPTAGVIAASLTAAVG